MCTRVRSENQPRKIWRESRGTRRGSSMHMVRVNFNVHAGPQKPPTNHHFLRFIFKSHSDMDIQQRSCTAWSLPIYRSHTALTLSMSSTWFRTLHKIQADPARVPLACLKNLLPSHILPSTCSTALKRSLPVDPKPFFVNAILIT